jgi:threonine dehydratase
MHPFPLYAQIWKQTEGKVDGFVCAAGTGGTIAGISAYLKSVKPEVKVRAGYFPVPPRTLRSAGVTGARCVQAGVGVPAWTCVGCLWACTPASRMRGVCPRCGCWTHTAPPCTSM